MSFRKSAYGWIVQRVPALQQYFSTKESLLSELRDVVRGGGEPLPAKSTFDDSMEYGIGYCLSTKEQSWKSSGEGLEVVLCESKTESEFVANRHNKERSTTVEERLTIVVDGSSYVFERDLGGESIRKDGNSNPMRILYAERRKTPSFERKSILVGEWKYESEEPTKEVLQDVLARVVSGY